MSENLFNARLNDEIKVSPAAAEQLSSLLDDEEGIDGIRIYVSGEGCSGMTYSMTFVEEPHRYDCLLQLDGLKMYVDAVTLGFMDGVEIDYQTEGLNKSFVFKNAFANSGGSGTCGGCGGAGGNNY
jgi:iron-sulfur cluster insertion protein